MEDYINGLRKMAEDLNRNLLAVKTWMTIQHTHNELFLESINELKARVKTIEKRLNIDA